MKLNLHILKEDLEKWNFNGTLCGHPWIRHCAYPVLCPRLPDTFEKEILYILRADILPEQPSAGDNISILCIGRPAELWLRGACSFLYTEHDVTEMELMNEVNRLFYHYQKWEKSLQEVLDCQLAYQEFFTRSASLLRNPVNVTGTFFLITCAWLPSAETESELYRFYKKNHYVKSGQFIKLEDINYLVSDPEYNDAANAKEPTVYSGRPFGYRSLFYNVFVKDVLIARICFDEVITPLIDRDFAFIQILGDYFGKALKKEDLYPFDRSLKLQGIFQKMLDHHMVPEEKIRSLLQDYQWNISDAYVCFVLELKAKDTAALEPLAVQLAHRLMNDCYIIKKQAIVFVCNLTKLNITRDALYALMLPFLRDNLLSAGISTIYHDFKNLYYFYNQAMSAKRIGEQKNPTHWYFKFEDYQLDYMLQKCTERTIPDIMIPEGLYALMEYDRTRGHDYTDTLRIYLECERNIADTIRRAYMHRNTFLYRIGRIQEILKMDLDKSENRLILLMAFRILDQS